MRVASAMTPEQQLALMRDPQRWPLKVALALAHATRTGTDGLPLLGFLVLGNGPRVYRGNVHDVIAEWATRAKGCRDGGHAQAVFNQVVMRLEQTTYISHAAMLGDGWEVN
jgi:hypothetical protein